MSRLIDLDANATTMPHPQVVARMRQSLETEWGNPSSANRLGDIARAAIGEARGEVAKLLQCRPEEVIFTSGATESINLGIQSLVHALGTARPWHVLASRLEHHAVLDTLRELHHQGRIELTLLPNDRHGRVCPTDVAAALRDDTVLVCLCHGNNEIGTLNPVREIGAILRNHAAYFLVDAAQTLGWCPPSVQACGIDLLAGSSHKMHGPKGVGILYLREGTPFRCILYGGGQEGEHRPGTQNTAAIVGAGVAARLAREEAPTRAERVRGMRDDLLQRLRGGTESLELNGHPTQRLPNNLNLTVPYVPADSLRRELYNRLALSRGSACTSQTGEPSHVLKAIGLTGERLMHWTIRLGLSALTEPDEVAEAAQLLVEKIAKLQQLAVR